MASGDPRHELAAAQAELDALESKILAKQAEVEATKDKNERAALRLEVQSAERQKAAATRRLKAAQVKLRKAELTTPAAAEDDWAEHVDAQTGNRFYFNTKTGESSWTKPASMSQSAEPALVKADETPKAAANVEEWTEHVDAQSGRTFYYNVATGETSWSKPGTVSLEPQQVQTAAAGAQEQDWTEHIDPVSGNNFYYNTKTGETS